MYLAVFGTILEISGSDPLLKMGHVSFSGVVREVSLAYVSAIMLWFMRDFPSRFLMKKLPKKTLLLVYWRSLDKKILR